MRKAVKEMNGLPDNTWLTNKYCNRFCGILIVDGKHIKVKGFKKKLPFIYCIDYLTHDIPVGILVPSESYQVFLKLFRLLKTINYPLQVVVCDDVVSALKPALLHYFPKAKVQLCQNHYLENIRQKLKVRTVENHVKFFNTIQTHIFKEEHHSKKEFNNVLHHLIKSHAKKDILRQQIVMDIYHRQKELFQYKTIANCPKTTNLIELYNSHIQSRLKSIKGFKSFKNAERWLNAYLIRRRTKSLTDCRGKFKKLNGKNSLELSIKKQANWPEILGVKAPKMKR